MKRMVIMIRVGREVEKLFYGVKNNAFVDQLFRVWTYFSPFVYLDHFLINFSIDMDKSKIDPKMYRILFWK